MDALDLLVDFARYLRDSSHSATPTSNGKTQHTTNQNSCESHSLQPGSIATPATRCYVRDVIGSATQVHLPATMHDVSSATYSGCEHNATNPRLLEYRSSYRCDERPLIQNQDRKMECVTCTRRDLDCQYAPPWTSFYPRKSPAYGDGGTDISHLYTYAPHYVSEADVFTSHGGEPYEHFCDGRCVCRGAVPIFECTVESYITGIINENHVREKEDAWMIVNLTDEQFREARPFMRE
jgi:hypothetical protein